MKKQNIHPQHRNQVRITGGQLRGRKIQFPDVEGLRPTPDSVRERLFNWLGQDLTGLAVLDLFAGSGALGFESASRHAKTVVMCELNRQAAAMLQQHQQMFQLAQQVQIHAQEALQFLAQTQQRFDIVLLDPPFRWAQWETLFARLGRCLNHEALVYIEAGDFPETPDYLEEIKRSKAGQGQQRLYRYCAE